MLHIRNPVEWGVDQIRLAGAAMARPHQKSDAMPTVRRVTVADLGRALARGIDDFAAFRSDVLFLALIYPIAGLVLVRLVFGYGLLPLVFPLLSGFALIGPVAAVGLYEMSRRRESGFEVGWADAFRVARAPAFGSIVLFGALLLAIFFVWLIVALAIYNATFGPAPSAEHAAALAIRDATFGPGSALPVAGFAHDVFETEAGWILIAAGVGTGFLFAVFVLAIGIVSVPLMLDRDLGLLAAIVTSLRVVRRNPGTIAVWGLIVAAGLVIGSIPLLLGLVVVMPVLGHASWHLYRRAVAPPGPADAQHGL
jgi:uncharacterized membrane protein